MNKYMILKISAAILLSVPAGALADSANARTAEKYCASTPKDSCEMLNVESPIPMPMPDRRGAKIAFVAKMCLNQVYVVHSVDPTSVTDKSSAWKCAMSRVSGTFSYEISGN